MTTDQLQALLRAVMDMEHRTRERISQEGYHAMAALAQDCDAPQFIVEYFARKAVCAEPTTTQE